ncbi:membrane integrity-associated transporter subunit PqiC [Novosphingobium profundi]|nr:membrane integrity-associated transporter subunit PqiC [Novosphingobium profundi]
MAGLAGLALAGCVSLAPEAPDSLLRLTPEHVAPAGTTTSGKLTDALVVLDPEADRSLDALRVPVRVDASSLAYLKDAGWVEKPTRLFRGLLAETIRAENGGMVLEGGDFEVTGKTFVGGRLLEMGYEASTQSVVVRFDAVLSHRGGDEIKRKRFEAVIPGVAPKAQTVGPALNRAANDVAGQVAAWVRD